MTSTPHTGFHADDQTREQRTISRDPSSSHEEANVNKMAWCCFWCINCSEKRRKQKAKWFWMRTWLGRRDHHGLSVLQRELEVRFYPSVSISVNSSMLANVSLNGQDVYRCLRSTFLFLIDGFLYLAILILIKNAWCNHPDKDQTFLKLIWVAPTSLWADRGAADQSVTHSHHKISGQNIVVDWGAWPDFNNSCWEGQIAVKVAWVWTRLYCIVAFCALSGCLN